MPTKYRRPWLKISSEEPPWFHRTFLYSSAISATAIVKLLEYGPTRMSILSSRRSWITFFRAKLILLRSSYQTSRTDLFSPPRTAMPPCALMYDCQRRIPWSACWPCGQNLPVREMDSPTATSVLLHIPNPRLDYRLRSRGDVLSAFSASSAMVRRSGRQVLEYCSLARAATRDLFRYGRPSRTRHAPTNIAPVPSEAPPHPR